LEDDTEWFDAISSVEENPHTNLFDCQGNYCKRYKAGHPTDEPTDEPMYFDAQAHIESSGETGETVYAAYPTERVASTKDPPTVTPADHDYKALRPNFAYLPEETIKKTFENTTQYGTIPQSEILKKRFKSPNPAFNVARRNEAVATDTVYADVPAVDDGSTSAQFFCGLDSQVCDAQGMKTDKQFINTLEDNIRKRGAPTRLVSDRAQVEISKKVLDILCSLFIGSWQSEPHQQHQNPAERRYQTVKRMVNTVLDRTGAPAYTWLLCLIWVCYILNHTFCAAINGIPMSHLTGTTTDISPLLFVPFWTKVYYKIDDSDFPSDSREGSGHMVGIGESVGHAMTYKILTDDTRKVIYRSNVRIASGETLNLRLEPLGGENSTPPEVLKSVRDHPKDKVPPHPPDAASAEEGETNRPQMPVFDPADLVGRSFLMDKETDGRRFCATIIKKLEDHDSDVVKNPTRIKFLCRISDKEEEEIISYNEMIEYIQRDEESDIVWQFKSIIGHQGPLKKGNPNYMGSSWNLMLEWEGGEITYEPLHVIAADDPVTCAIFGRDQGLLNKPRRKRF